MSKHAFLSALEKALSGLPADQVADIVGDYERHFIDGKNLGRSDAELAKALGEPRKIALEFKAMLRVDAYQQRRSMGNFVRMALSTTGLAFFNLFLLPFLLVPPLLLLSVYLAGAIFGGGGAVLTASALTGVSEMVVSNGGGPRMAFVVEPMMNGTTGAGLRQSDDRAVFELPPYTIRYGARTNAESAAARVNRGSSMMSMTGGVYFGVGLLLLWLGRRFGTFIWRQTGRYLHGQVRLVRAVRSPLPAPGPAGV